MFAAFFISVVAEIAGFHVDSALLALVTAGAGHAAHYAFGFRPGGGG